MIKRLACLLPALLLPVLAAACAPVPPPEAGSASLQVTATAIPLSTDDPARTRVGALEYRGGVPLASRGPRFGRPSGLRRAPRRALAVLDPGAGLRFHVRVAGGWLTRSTHVPSTPLTRAGRPPPY